MWPNKVVAEQRYILKGGSVLCQEKAADKIFIPLSDVGMKRQSISIRAL